jgi:hypothetical protein
LFYAQNHRFSTSVHTALQPYRLSVCRVGLLLIRKCGAGGYDTMGTNQE